MSTLRLSRGRTWQWHGRARTEDTPRALLALGSAGCAQLPLPGMASRTCCGSPSRWPPSGTCCTSGCRGATPRPSSCSRTLRRSAEARPMPASAVACTHSARGTAGAGAGRRGGGEGVRTQLSGCSGGRAAPRHQVWKWHILCSHSDGRGLRGDRDGDAVHVSGDGDSPPFTPSPTPPDATPLPAFP